MKEKIKNNYYDNYHLLNEVHCNYDYDLYNLLVEVVNKARCVGKAENKMLDYMNKNSKLRAENKKLSLKCNLNIFSDDELIKELSKRLNKKRVEDV